MIIVCLSIWLRRRFLFYDDVAQNNRLAESSLETHKTHHLFSCIQLCTSNPLCLSINYCRPSTCELNYADISTAKDKMSNASGCVYVGMDPKTSPLCLVENLINNRSDKDVCNIADKEVITKWSAEVVVVLFINYEYERHLRRICQLSRGGVNDSCELGTTDLEFEEHLKIIQNELTWSEAQDACLREGGHLFYDFYFNKSRDKIEERLNFTINLINETFGEFREFWVGIRTDLLSADKFVSIHKKTVTIPEFVWGNPDQPDGQDCLLIIPTNNSQIVSGHQYLHDGYCDEKLVSICQIGAPSLNIDD